jgi:hypothetical protein
MPVRWFSAAAALLAAAALGSSPSSEAALPRLLFGTVSSCSSQSRASYDAILGSMRRADPLGLQRLARGLRDQAATCAARVAAVKATKVPACGRAVAVRGLRFYRDGGQTMDAAVTAGLQPGASVEVFSQSILRGVALVRVAESELSVALEVIAGKRGCAKGVASFRTLSAATQRALPALAQQAATMLIQAQGEILPEDRVAFGLLTVQLDTGTPPPASAAESQIVNLTNQNPNIQKWRLAGLRTFWVKHATEVDWSRYRFGPQLFVQSFQTYLTWKVTALQNQRNQFLSGIVGSEEAWQKAVGDWKAWETRWYTREQASIAAYDAWERSFKAERVLLEAEAALRRSP